MQQADERVASQGTKSAFSNKKVIPVRIDDPRVYAIFTRSQCWHMQWDDDPTMIVVGPGATNGSLERMAGRFGIPLQTLVDLRAAQTMRSAS